MKKITFILITVFGFAQTIKADTIDNWHVYYNKNKIAEFNVFGKNEINLNENSIKNGDSLSVEYGTDTPCWDCSTHLTVEDEEHHILITSKGKGTFNPVSFSLKDLVALKKKVGKNFFKVYYSEREIKHQPDEKPIFIIKFDSTQTTTPVKENSIGTTGNTTEFDETDDFSPMVFVVALIGFGLILASIGAGIALTVLGLFIILGLVSLGVLSTSIIVGLNKKSFAKGFKTFVVLSSTVFGLLMCGAGFFFLNTIFHWTTSQIALLSGATCGLLAGLLVGLSANFILQKLTDYFKTKLNLTN